MAHFEIPPTDIGGQTIMNASATAAVELAEFADADQDINGHSIEPHLAAELRLAGLRECPTRQMMEQPW